MLIAKPLVLGGHETTCKGCNNTIYSYNSCGDSNCPQCQNIKKQLWIDKMVNHLLPVKHFHLIFTLPHELNDLVFYNKRKLYDLLFQTAKATIEKLLGGKIGMIATLHSWGSNLSFHPHLHVIVAAGSYKNGEWHPSVPNNPNCFCNAKELRETFKELFLKGLLYLIEFEDLQWSTDAVNDEVIFPKIRQIYHKIRRKKWVVRIENPVLRVEQIVEYLARYVRRVAITNSRIESIDNEDVVINYKQYSQQQAGKPPPIGKMTFEGPAFIHQFAQHFMPRKFHKVRYYGFYNFSAKQLKNEIYKKLTGNPIPVYKKPSKKQILRKMLGHDPDVCTNCGLIGAFEVKPLVTIPNQIYVLTRPKPKSASNILIRAGPIAAAQLGVSLF